MNKTFCDVCGKETQEHVKLHIQFFRTLSLDCSDWPADWRSPFEFDLCRRCGPSVATDGGSVDVPPKVLVEKMMQALNRNKVKKVRK